MSANFIDSLGTPKNLKVRSPIPLPELEDGASLTWPDAAVKGIQPIEVTSFGKLPSSGKKELEVTPKNTSSGSGQPDKGSADKELADKLKQTQDKLKQIQQKYNTMKKSLGEEIAQRDEKIAELEQVNSDRLEEIATLNAQLKERGEIDGILHSGGEPVPTDPFIREKRLREQLGKINVDLRLSKQSEAAAKAQTFKAENRIMELEAKVSNLPEDSSTDLELLRANATREMTDLKKARDEFGATRLTLLSSKRPH